jgi:hypothetical protein
MIVRRRFRVCGGEPWLVSVGIVEPTAGDSLLCQAKFGVSLVNGRRMLG